MPLPPPDLSDPAQRAAYRRELRNVARPLRYTGIAFAVIGVILALLRAQSPQIMPAPIPIAAIVIGLFNMLAAIGARTRYHVGRMRADD